MTRLFDRQGLLGHARKEQVVEENRRTRSGEFWIARREQAQGGGRDVEAVSELVG
jgi:hypothetical protein